MKLELKIEQIHQQNLESISRLAYFADRIHMVKKMISGFITGHALRDKDIFKDIADLESKVHHLKTTMIRIDGRLLSFLCTGKLIPEDKLHENRSSLQQVDQLNYRYNQLRKKLTIMLRGAKE